MVESTDRVQNVAHGAKAICAANAIISGVANDIDLSPIGIDDETRQDMEAIAILINRATKEGLLVEVLWSAFQHGSRNIMSKCYYGLSEWDC